MKSLLSIGLSLWSLTVFAQQPTSEANTDLIRVEVNGVPASYDGTPPQMLHGRVMIPVRGTLEQIDAEVTWDEATQTMTATRKGKLLKLKIGQKFATLDEQQIAMEVPAQVIKGRTLVPLRFMSEALGAQVDWDGPTHTVRIQVDKSHALTQNELVNVDKVSFSLQRHTSSRSTRIFGRPIQRRP